MGWAAVLGVLAGAMLVFPGEAAWAAGEGLSLWARSVVPALGPFMACMLMVTSRAGGGMALRVILSWLCGSPGGARLMRTLRLREKPALRAAALTGTMSPMFFLGTVSAWLDKPAAGPWLLGCHWLSALILGLLLPGRAGGRVRGQGKGQAAPMPPGQPGRASGTGQLCGEPFTLFQALRDTALTLLTVGLCMALGSVSARMAACALPGLPPPAAAALQCALEITSGVRSLIALSSPWTLPLVCAACAFGGLSLLLQNAAFWQESGVPIGWLFLLRLLHGALAGLLGWIVHGLGLC